MSETFMCSICGFVGEKIRSDEEASAECDLIWGKTKPEDRAVICHDCFHRGFAKAHAEFMKGKLRN